MPRPNAQLTRVFQQALALSDDERAELVAELLATLPDRCDQDDADLTAAQHSKLQCRLGDLERGEVRAVPWYEARAQLQERLASVRRTLPG